MADSLLRKGRSGVGIRTLCLLRHSAGTDDPLKMPVSRTEAQFYASRWEEVLRAIDGAIDPRGPQLGRRVSRPAVADLMLVENFR